MTLSAAAFHAERVQRRSWRYCSKGWKDAGERERHRARQDARFRLAALEAKSDFADQVARSSVKASGTQRGVH